MKKLKLLGLLTFSLMVAGSCTKDKETGKPDIITGRDIYPLETGNYWEYGNIRYEVTGKVLLGGIPYFTVIVFPINVQDSNSQYFIDSSYYRNDGNKTFIRQSQDLNENLMFDFSMSVGDKHLIQYYDVNNGGKDHENIFLIDKGDTVQLGSTIIDSCYRFGFDVIEWMDEESSVWVRPYLGIVKKKSEGWGIESLLTRVRINGKVMDFR